MTSTSPRTLLNVFSSLLYALLLRIALVSLTGVRADSVIGNYDSISSGATIVKSDADCASFSTNVRLVPYNGNLKQGTPQVLHDGIWGTIDNDYWDYNDAQVFCKELGMGDVVSYGGYGQFGQSYGTQWAGFNCQGTESSLQDCNQANGDWAVMDYGSENNPNYDDASVVCTNDYSPCTGFTISTAAGTGSTGYSSSISDANSANLYNPYGLAVDSSGNIYIADTQNSVIRKFSEDGYMTTVAGTGTAGYSSDSTGTSAKLNSPKGVAVDSSGNVYIADTSNNRVRLVTAPVSPSCTAALKQYDGKSTEGTVMVLYEGVWSTIYGYWYWDRDEANVFCNQLGMGNSNSYTVQQYGNGNSYSLQLFGYSCQGSESTLQDCTQQSNYNNNGRTYINKYGSAQSPNYADAAVNCSHVSTSSSPCFYKSYNISIVAGTGASGSAVDEALAVSSSLDNPIGVALDSSGNVYVADGGNSRIRKITKSTGIIKTYAGGGKSFKDDVDATSTTLSSTIGICVGSAGYVYIADGGNNRVRRIINGVISTIAGTGTSGYDGDNGPASSASLSNPSGVAVYVSSSKKVTVYIADTGNNCVRQIFNSIISTIAGTGTSGYSGDNGPATSATLYNPTGIAVDSSSGDIYVADNGNHRIRKITYSSSTSPSSVVTFAPSTPHLISFPLLMTVDNWPYIYVPAKSEQAILTLVTDITDTSNVNVNLTISEKKSQRRRLLSSYR